MQPHALTLVLNPHARKPRLRPPSVDVLQARLGPDSRIHVTQNLDELDQLMSAWSEEEETLCFYGGDGSIARGLTSLVRHQGEDFNLPPVLTVRAGTINMLCNILGFRESVDRTLARWTRRELSGQRLIPMLKVEVEGEPPQYGFIFAWGVGYRVLRDYYAKSEKPDVLDAVATMASTFAAALGPGADEHRLFRAENIDLRVDGLACAGSAHALTVGTIERLSLGIRPFPPEPIKAGGFHYSSNGMSLGRVALHSPSLLFGMGDLRSLEERYAGRLRSGANARELTCVLSEGFTMDGEMFELPEPRRVRLAPGPVVRFWTKSNA